MLEAERPLTIHVVGIDGETRTLDWLSNAGFAVSMTASDWLPAVLRLTKKECAPWSAGVNV